MTRDDFLRKLRRGLSGMDPDAIEDNVSDYAAHFDAAREDGRSEVEVAEALGDPWRIARELKLEAGVRRWEEGRSPSSAMTAVIGVLGLGALDILVLAPILLPIIGVIFGLYMALLCVFIAGAAAFIAGPFSGFPGGILAAVFGGLGIMAAAIAGGALLTIVTTFLINALIWFGRLHVRVIKPAIAADGPLLQGESL
ncbi:MAG: DUF1700 domain-containing protein [Pseudomonadota bacterium]|nr:DUF1700 domain-containing protein [Pseudomonadota bacterium]